MPETTPSQIDISKAGATVQPAPAPEVPPTVPEAVPAPAPAPEAPPITAAPGSSPLAVFSHVGGLFTTALAPLVLYFVARSSAKHAFAVPHAREALNFQITILLAFIVLFVLTKIPVISVFAWALLPALIIGDILFVVFAAFNAVNGQPHRYPIALRLVK